MCRASAGKTLRRARRRSKIRSALAAACKAAGAQARSGFKHHPRLGPAMPSPESRSFVNSPTEITRRALDAPVTPSTRPKAPAANNSGVAMNLESAIGHEREQIEAAAGSLPPSSSRA